MARTDETESSEEAQRDRRIAPVGRSCEVATAARFASAPHGRRRAAIGGSTIGQASIGHVRPQNALARTAGFALRTGRSLATVHTRAATTECARLADDAHARRFGAVAIRSARFTGAARLVLTAQYARTVFAHGALVARENLAEVYASARPAHLPMWTGHPRARIDAGAIHAPLARRAHHIGATDVHADPSGRARFPVGAGTFEARGHALTPVTGETRGAQPVALVDLPIAVIVEVIAALR